MSRSVRVARAMTLPEIIVVFGLLGLLMTMISLYFVQGRQYASETEVYSTVQRNATLTVSKLSEKLTKATPAHLKLFDHAEPGSSDAIAFLSFHSNDPDEPYIVFGGGNGEITWRNWVCFYHDPASSEVREVVIPLTPATPNLASEPLPNVDLSSFLAQSTQRPVAQEIQSLSFQDFGGDRVLVSVTARGFSPVTSRSQEDRLVEVRIDKQIVLTN